MKRYIAVFTAAIAAAFAFSTSSAYAVDWPAPGETYTVPANTTNEVSDADIEAYNALGLVEFTDETSALRFTASIAPNVNLKGRGWMIVDYPGDATLMITQQQTTAWIGTWDFRDGAIGLGNSKAGSYSALFTYEGKTGLHDVYVREGATITFYNSTYCIHAYSDVRLHIAGRVNLSPGGYSPRLRQIEVDSDSAILSLGGSCIPDFMELTYNGVLYLPYINLNGHHLFSPGSGYDQSCFQVRDTDLKIAGPGSMNINASSGTGIRVKSTNSSKRGSLDITDGAVVTGNLEIAAYFPNPTGDFGCFGTVRQKDGSSFIIPYAPNQRPPFKLGGVGGGRPAYLLESGVLDAQNGMIMNGGTNVTKTSYTHFRQTGGDFSTRWIAITNLVAGLNADLAFGGSGTAKITNNGLDIMGDATFSFCDSVKFSVTGGIVNRGGHHVWAYKGGTAETRFVESGGFTYPVGDFFALDGGACAYGHASEGSSTNLFGNSPEIRVYERGGEISIHSGERVTVFGVNFQEPAGNVLKSIELSAAATNTVFATPPSVVITDTEGTGSNAAAVVDYDFDTKKVKNITIVSRGENYTAPKANLRYVDGSTLLATPLNCTVGPEDPSCGFAYSATNLGSEIYLNQTTNFTHGTLVVDMDRLGLADYGAYTTAAWCNTLHLHYIHNGTAARAAQAVKNSYFPNATSIVLKSGCIDAYNNEGGWGYNHTHNPCGILPNCWRLELYGGHLTGGSARFEDVVIGGEIWLINHGLWNNTGAGRMGDIRVCRTSPTNDDAENYPGLLTVDVACLTNDVTPKIKYGNVHFFRGQVNPNTTIPLLVGRTNSVVTVKNWEYIPKSRTWTTILDLTDNVTVNAEHGGRTFCVPDIAYPDGAEDKLQIRWELDGSGNPYRLLARHIINGTILIFK